MERTPVIIDKATGEQELHTIQPGDAIQWRNSLFELYHKNGHHPEQADNLALDTREFFDIPLPDEVDVEQRRTLADRLTEIGL
jgi:hypothetical protein